MLRPGLFKYHVNTSILNSLRLDSLSRRIKRDVESRDYLSRLINGYWKPSMKDLTFILENTEIMMSLDAGNILICINNTTGDLIYLSGGIIQPGTKEYIISVIIDHLQRHKISNRAKLDRIL